MDWDALLDAAAAARVRAALDGAALPNRLRIADLEPGQAGLLEAQVRAVSGVRPYTRKRGGEGLMCRVTLADGTGDVDLVLWDEEVRLARDGPLAPGAHVRLHGPLVKAGYRGGVELGLGSAQVSAIPRPAQEPSPQPIQGRLVSIGDVHPVGAPPALRFTCDLAIEAEADAAASHGRRTLHVTVWDQAVKSARQAGLGRRIRIARPVPNPFLPGWWTAVELEALDASEKLDAPPEAKAGPPALPAASAPASATHK